MVLQHMPQSTTVPLSSTVFSGLVSPSIIVYFLLHTFIKRYMYNSRTMLLAKLSIKNYLCSGFKRLLFLGGNFALCLTVGGWGMEITAQYTMKLLFFTSPKGCQVMTHSHDVFLWHVAGARFPCCLLEDRISLLQVGEKHSKDRKMQTSGRWRGNPISNRYQYNYIDKAFFPG